MPILVVDGPEKAGKTTLIHAVAQEWCSRMGKGSEAWRKHWGPVQTDVEYKAKLEQNVTELGPQKLIIWDRSWASESVYGLLLERPGRRLADDPWLGEWLYGRAVQAIGLRVMLTADSWELAARRDETDLPVSPQVEAQAFIRHGSNYGWAYLKNTYTDANLQENARTIVNVLISQLLVERAAPPIYCGPADAKIVVVGEGRNEGSQFPGAWLPLTTPLTTLLGRSLGDRAFQLGWTNAHDIPPGTLRSAQVLVALGEDAQQFCQLYVGHNRVVGLPHPAWLYRYGRAKEQIPVVEAKLLDIVNEVYGVSK